jgi:hypothetical protein
MLRAKAGQPGHLRSCRGLKPVMTSFNLGMGRKGYLNKAIPALIATLEKEGAFDHDADHP